MSDWLYVMFIDKGKDYKKINKAMVIKHVEYINYCLSELRNKNHEQAFTIRIT